MRLGVWPLAALLLGSAVLSRAADEEGEEEEEEEEAADYGDEHMTTGGDEDDESSDSFEHEPLLTGEQMRSLFGRLDSNADGQVTMEELMDHATSHTHGHAGHDVHSLVSDIDADGDGKISLQEHLRDLGDDEAQAGYREVETAKFRAADVDKDGFLNNDELRSLFFPTLNDAVLQVEAEQNLKEKDTDGDGKLSEAEFFGVEDMEKEGPQKEERATFTRLDKDGDGFINAAELKSYDSGHFHTDEAMTELFQIADRNKDKLITVDELVDATDEINKGDEHERGGNALLHLLQWIEHHEHTEAEGHHDREEL